MSESQADVANADIDDHIQETFNETKHTVEPATSQITFETPRGL